MKKLEKRNDFFNARFKDYDEIHTSHIDGGMESKNVIASLLQTSTKKLLDIGIGTGLELKAIFNEFTDVHYRNGYSREYAGTSEGEV